MKTPSSTVFGALVALAVSVGSLQAQTGTETSALGQPAPREATRRSVSATRVMQQVPGATGKTTVSRKEALPVLGATTIGLMASPLGNGPFLAASALVPGRTGKAQATRIIRKRLPTQPALPLVRKWRDARREFFIRKSRLSRPAVRQPLPGGFDDIEFHLQIFRKITTPRLPAGYYYDGLGDKAPRFVREVAIV